MLWYVSRKHLLTPAGVGRVPRKVEKWVCQLKGRTVEKLDSLVLDSVLLAVLDVDCYCAGMFFTLLSCHHTNCHHNG